MSDLQIYATQNFDGARAALQRQAQAIEFDDRFVQGMRTPSGQYLYGMKVSVRTAADKKRQIDTGG